MFRLPWVFTAACTLALVAASGGYSLVVTCGLLPVVRRHTGSRACGLQYVWCVGSEVAAHGLRGLWNLAHIPRTGRQILNHRTTRRIPDDSFLIVSVGVIFLVVALGITAYVLIHH